jgi:hypothetical protein
MTVVQDVPVRILSGQEVASKVEPQVDQPTVRLISPPIKILSNIVERLKGLDDK